MNQMARYKNNEGFDEGLQTDVMRFMAIIAFCLIAIMRLVDNIEPDIVSIPPPVAKVDAIERIPIEPVGMAVAMNVETLVETALETFTKSAVQPIADAVAPIEVISVTDRELDDSPETKVASQRSISDKPPLGLRFASDESFISLIAASDIQLYARDGDQYLMMTNRFTTEYKRPTGELYELMSTSVPQSVVALMEKILKQPTYLVSLSSATKADLQRKLLKVTEDEASGTLVIHRDGHVSHEI